MSNFLLRAILCLLVLARCYGQRLRAAEHLSPCETSPTAARLTDAHDEFFEFCGEFDPGRGGAYNLALNAAATRLFVVGESSWLDILDISDLSSIRSLAHEQFEGMPYGPDGEYGIAFDPHFQRVAIGGGVGSKIFLLDVSGDQLRLLDKASPPERQFPGAEFEGFLSTSPIFIERGAAIAAAMYSSRTAVDPSSGQTVYFGQGVYLLSIDPLTETMSVVDEGIGGDSTFYRQLYDSPRNLLWCGGQDGAEAIADFSHGPLEQYRYWSRRSGDWRSRVFPDLVTHDGKWLIERVASLHPPDHWFIRIRQIEAANGSYSLWNAEMPTDGAAPRLLGSPINWSGDTDDPGSRISSKPLLPCVLTRDETHLITAEAGGNQLLVLDLSDKTTEPHLLFSVNVGEGEKIQSIKGYRNRFYVSLKCGRIVAYEWNFVYKPGSPWKVSAVASPLAQSITLSWSPPSTGLSPAGYYVHRKTGSGPFLKVAVTTETAWSDDSTAEGTTYAYRIRSFAPAYRPIESDDSPEAQATTPSGIPPAKVIGLSGEATLGGVSLSWKPNSEADVSGYLVYRKSGDAPFVRITSSPLTESRCLDLNLNQERDYSYYIAAVDANLEGPASDTVTLSPASGTANLLLNAGAEQQCTRHWTNASTTFPRDPANRYSFDNDLFIAVTNSQEAEGQWTFWADQTSGRYDRQNLSTVDESYSLAAYQDVDVSAFCEAIDSAEREIIADWGAQVIRTSQSDSVVPSIAIEFLDADGVVLERHELSSQTTGEWVVLSSSNSVVSSTRCVRFWMFASTVSAASANAAWDGLSLILREEQSYESPPVGITASGSGVTLSFGPTMCGMTYQIEYTDGLCSGEGVWKPCGPPFGGDGAIVQWLDSSDEHLSPTYPPAADVKRRFYRVTQQ